MSCFLCKKKSGWLLGMPQKDVLDKGENITETTAQQNDTEEKREWQ